MIEIQRLDNTKLILNSEQIESIEQIPDTIITLSNGKKIIVKDDAKDLIKRIINFKFETIRKKTKTGRSIERLASV